jgi:uncharacterized protein YoxC
MVTDNNYIFQELQEISSTLLAEQTSFNDEAFNRRMNLLSVAAKQLNKEIDSYRGIKNNICLNTAIDQNIRDRFLSLIPKERRQLLKDANPRTIRELFLFFEVNRAFFQDIFRTQEEVIAVARVVYPNISPSFADEFPALADRINRNGRITVTELSQFVEREGINIESLGSQLDANSRNIMNLFNQFVSGLGSAAQVMGDFCSLTENFFSLVQGQRDILDGAQSLAGDLNRIAQNLPSFIGEITERAQSILGLIQNIRNLSQGMQVNMQEAISLLGQALGIIMSFFPDSSGAPSGKFEITWNLEKIRDDLDAANTVFEVVISATNKPLGDINQDGSITQEDVDLFTDYIDGANTITDSTTSYIEDTMFTYMIDNIEVFAEYAEFPSGSSSGSFAQTVSDFKQAFDFLAGIAGGGGGDFGQNIINQMLSQVSGMISEIQQLIGVAQSISQLVSNQRVEIGSVLNTLQQLQGSSIQAISSIFNDFNEIQTRFRTTVERSLGEAEAVSVSNPTRTREVSESNVEAHSQNVSAATRNLGQIMNELGPQLNSGLNTIRGLMENLAATGILENTASQLRGVVGQSINQLQSRISTLEVERLSNQYDFNMTPVFARFATEVARAREATTDDARRNMEGIVDGHVALAAERYRNLNRRDVDFVASRFCQFAGEIERVYRDITRPAEQMIQQNADSLSELRSAESDTTTQRAIAAGAIRLPREARVSAAQRAGASIPATVATPYVNPNTGRRTTVPPPGAAPSEGYGPTPIVPTSYGNLPSFDDLKNNQVWNGLFRFGGGMNRSRNNWDPILRLPEGVDMLRKFLNVANTWKVTGGPPLVIISAFRRGARTPSGRVSEHSLGRALDVEMRGRINQIRLMNIAYNAGFRGFGSYTLYGGFVHIDTAGGSWGTFRYYNLSGSNGNKS